MTVSEGEPIIHKPLLIIEFLSGGHRSLHVRHLIRFGLAKNQTNIRFLLPRQLRDSAQAQLTTEESFASLPQESELSRKTRSGWRLGRGSKTNGWRGCFTLNTSTYTRAGPIGSSTSTSRALSTKPLFVRSLASAHRALCFALRSIMGSGECSPPERAVAHSSLLNRARRLHAG